MAVMMHVTWQGIGSDGGGQLDLMETGSASGTDLEAEPRAAGLGCTVAT